MAHDIEYCTVMKSLPVNSHVMLNRLHELLEKKNTNCLAGIREDWAVKSVMWLLMSQVFGQLDTINMVELWDEINTEYLSKEV